ncbi:hypothetical protein Fmac_001616 [Flemingia macrophylla]|uniref:Uncharacterized protein n=1 Tax=Flemingia macrophylla TaxID=520843 RepID=A0ABD1NHR9_9FABA
MGNDVLVTAGSISQDEQRKSASSKRQEDWKGNLGQKSTEVNFTPGEDSKRIPTNSALNRYVEALAAAWSEYNNPRAVIMIVVQAEERNMYDQHLVSTVL